MLQLAACLSESCDGITYTDETKLFSVDNPGGYGVTNDVTGPADFGSYHLFLWAPDVTTPTADNVTFDLNLQTDVPPIDADEDYVWEFSLEDLDVTKLISGWWYMRALGIKDGVPYEVNSYVLFTSDIRTLVDAAVQNVKLDSDCSGCVDPLRLAGLLDIIAPRCSCGCSDVCYMEKSKAIVTYLYSVLPKCCC